VDAAVTDKKGNAVHDLAAKDFHVWEDGKEQPITSLSVETATDAPEKASKHYLVLFFDNVTLPISEQLAVRRDAARFVSAWAASDRYTSVVDFGPTVRLTQGFSALPGPLEQAIAGVQPSGQTPPMIQLESRALAGTQSAGQVQGGTGTGMDASNAQAPPRPGGGGRGRGGPPATSDDQALTQSSGAPFAQQNLLSGLQSVAESLASIRGRKALVLFTGGFPAAPSGSQMAALISACNSANVAVYVANPSSYRWLADGTGGRTILNANDLVGELGRIAEQQEEHYVLGYEPPESPAGSCHNLRVAVDRPGVDVEARKGYCGAKPVVLMAAGAAAKAIAAPPPAGNLGASMELPYFYASANVARVNLAMEIASAAIKFDKLKGKPHAELHVTGVASRADGEVAGRFDDAVKLDFESAKESEAFGKQPYHYEYQFELAPGEYRLRVKVDAGDGVFGNVEAPLSIAPWDGRRLGVSGVAFSKETHPVANLASSLDDSLLEDRRPLTAGSHEIVPSGNNRFGPADLKLAYLEIYDPALAGPHPGALTLRIRVLDPQTGKPKLDMGTFDTSSFIRPGNPVVPVAFNLPDTLPAGAYRLEVTAAHAAGADAVVRTGDFVIER